LNELTFPPADPARHDRRFITAIGIAQICAWGSLFYSFPVIATAMTAEFGWSKTEIYVAATLGLALAALAAFPVGAAIDAGHGRKVMAGASLAAALLLGAWSRIETLGSFYLVFALIGALHAATLYEPAFAVATRRFGPSGARRAITELTLWGGFASTVFIPLIQVTMDALGWRMALLVLAAINAACALLYWLVINSSRDAAPEAARSDAVAELAGRHAVAWAARLPVFWALAIAFLAYAAAFSSLTFHIYPMLLERGLSSAGTVAVLTVIGPAQVAGRVVVWLLAAKAPVRTVGSVIVAVFPLTILGFAYAPTEVVVMGAIAVLYGAANGMMTIVRGLAVPEMVGRHAYGAINGALTAPMHMVQALAPLAAAAIWTAYGGYGAVMLSILGGTLVLAASFWLAACLTRS
jgi:predicted MFS family arabinose efflux permease